MSIRDHVPLDLKCFTTAIGFYLKVSNLTDIPHIWKSLYITCLYKPHVRAQLNFSIVQGAIPKYLPMYKFFCKMVL